MTPRVEYALVDPDTLLHYYEGSLWCLVYTTHFLVDVSPDNIF